MIEFCDLTSSFSQHESKSLMTRATCRLSFAVLMSRQVCGKTELEYLSTFYQQVQVLPALFPPIWLTTSTFQRLYRQSRRQHAATTLSDVLIFSLPFPSPNFFSSTLSPDTSHLLHTTLQAEAFSLLISHLLHTVGILLLQLYLNIDNAHPSHFLGAASSSRCVLPTFSWHSA